MSEQPDEVKPAFPSGFRRLLAAGVYAYLATGVAALTFHLTHTVSPVLHLAALVATAVSGSAAVAISIVLTVWMHLIDNARQRYQEYLRIIETPS